jgi:hypothetical protein
MGNREPSVPLTPGTEVMLRRLERAVSTMAARDEGSPARGQVDRQFDVLAAEVRSDAPLADLARAAGTGLIEASGRWDDLRPEVSTTVGDLLDWVDMQAVTGGGWATGDVAATEEEAAADAVPAAPASMIEPPPGIGVPILPDDEG